jgi:catechol 2,3-dioxygenase-like lactoylglutathione lyase family enzyme
VIEGISHITFIVGDLSKMKKLLEYIFDAREVYCSGEDTFSTSKEKFFLIKDLWIAIMEGDPLQNRTYNHVAFKIEEKDFETFKDKITHLGLELREARSRVQGEGHSLYFYDYDNHLFELHTGTLTERLDRYQNSR